VPSFKTETHKRD